MTNKPSSFTKGRYKLKFRGTECRNCGHLLDVSDKYCSNCSQANSTKKLGLKDFIDEFFSSLISYDSKLFKTLYALLVKPGSITKDYINGKRITYTNPFRFLLSLAFVYFLLFTYNNNFSSWDKAAKTTKKTGPISFNLMTGDVSVDSLDLRNEAEKGLRQLDSLGAKDEKIEQQLQILDSLDLLGPKASVNKLWEDSTMLSDPKAHYKNIADRTGFKGLSLRSSFFYRMIRKDSLNSFEEAKEKYGASDNLKTRMSFNLSSGFIKALRAPGSFVNDTLSKLPFVIFFFLPLFSIFIWVAYIRKNYTYTDHLIFSFHNQSLLFILLILSLIIDVIFNTVSTGIFFIIFGIYLYKSMRKFYGQGRVKTILKYCFLNTVFSILALLAGILLFTGSFFTY